MRGLFIGRFQPLHNGHVSIIEAALKEVDQLVIVIGSAENSFSERDPFTAGERMEMLIRASKELGWGERVLIIPIRDINRYSVWVDHVLSYVPPVDVVYSNNRLTRMLFLEKGMEVRSTILVERSDLSGIRIRELMINGREWKDRVPSSVSSFIEDINGAQRVKEIHEQGDDP
jgi:nicotinamide-nucleotide adenylyltransferase